MIGDLHIVIDGERLAVNHIEEGYYLPMIETDGGDFYIAEDSEKAGEAARKYWEELAQNDPEEFVCIVGQETLVKWALGQYAGPGSMQVQSLEEWLDLWLETPEEQWAGWDGVEREVDRVGQLAEELGFVPTVAYRN